MSRKPVFWLITICVAAMVVAGTVILNSSRQPKELTEQDYARQYIEQVIAQYQTEWPEAQIVDSRIVKFERINEFDHLLEAPVGIWRLEYRLTPEDPGKIVLPGGMQAVDGEITEDGSMGKPMLIFSYQEARPEYLGAVWNGENDLTTPAGQETALRKFFEGKGLLAHETFSGNHVLVKFPLTSGDTSQLLLSQPVKQGEQGIWAVERWKDTNGNEYYHTPRTEETLEAYYKGLQNKADQETDPLLLDPLEVAVQYIKNELGQPVNRDKLVISYEATAADFTVAPESSLLGYVTGFAMDSDTLRFDQVEWLTLEDTDRLESLHISKEQMPGGFYILNKYAVDDLYKVTAETEYELIDRENWGSMKSVSKQEFIAYYELFSSFGPPCKITISNDAVHTIREVYVP